MELLKENPNEDYSPGAQAAGENAPNGPCSAAVLASGIGAMAYGIFVILSEALKPVSKFLTFSVPVGPLSGKTTMGVIIWLIAWAVYHMLWKSKEVNFDKVTKITMVLIGLGLLFTFPPFFQLFH